MPEKDKKKYDADWHDGKVAEGNAGQASTVTASVSSLEQDVASWTVRRLLLPNMELLLPSSGGAPVEAEPEVDQEAWEKQLMSLSLPQAKNRTALLHFRRGTGTDRRQGFRHRVKKLVAS